MNNTTVLDFGETTDPPIRHSLASSDIPASFYSTILTRYGDFKNEIANLVPKIPTPLGDLDLAGALPDLDEAGLRRLLANFTPSVLAWYQISEGDCDDLEAVEIKLIRDKAVDLETGGASVWDIEVSVSASYEIIPHIPKIDEEARCRTEEYQEWLDCAEAWRVYREELSAWEAAQEAAQEEDNDQALEELGPPPERPDCELEPFDGERFEERRRKTGRFDIYWFLTVTVLRFVYTVDVHKQTHFVCTKCCD